MVRCFVPLVHGRTSFHGFMRCKNNPHAGPLYIRFFTFFGADPIDVGVWVGWCIKGVHGSERGGCTQRAAVPGLPGTTKSPKRDNLDLRSIVDLFM